MIYLRLHKTEDGSIMVAMCDKDVMGKVLEEDKKVIDLSTYAGFYKGSLVDREAAMKEIEGLEEISSANIVGKEATRLAIDMRLIEEGHVMTVQSVPYAQAFSMKGK